MDILIPIRKNVPRISNICRIDEKRNDKFEIFRKTYCEGSRVNRKSQRVPRIVITSLPPSESFLFPTDIHMYTPVDSDAVIN